MSDVSETAAQSTDDPAARLQQLGVPDGTIVRIMEELGVSTVDGLVLLTVEDLTGLGMKTVPARQVVAALKPAVAAVVDAPTISAAALDSVLPAAPDDGPWLAALRAGGVLKIDTSSMVAAIRAALAARVRLYDVPGLLVAEMERFAESNDEQVDPLFFKLRKQLTRKNYAEIFEAVDGLDGTFVTDARKRQLFDRIDENLWPAVGAFYAQLKAWQDAWLQQGANPAMLMAMLAGGGSALPPGLMQPPDTGVLRDQSAAVADAVNRVFRGYGVQIAAALAYEATQIRMILEDPRLPGLIGASNRDQMLRQLGVAISPAYARLETNLTRFVLAAVQAQDQPADTELAYFGALYMLGSQMLPELEKSTASGAGRITPIGGGTARAIGGAALRGRSDLVNTDGPLKMPRFDR